MTFPSCGNVGHKKMDDITQFYNKHKGETIFIYGNSEELADLTPPQISFLEKQTSIGVNYSHEIINSTYLMTGHQSHVLYAMEYKGKDNFDAIFFQSAKPNPIFKNKYEKVFNLPCDTSRNISGQIGKHNKKLGGCSNIGTSITHMAYILGASKIIYIGFNQKNVSHFYNKREELKKLMVDRIYKVMEKYKDQYPKKLFDDYVSHIGHMKPLETLRKLKWESNPHNINNTPIFRQMFNTLKKDNIKIYATCKESVMVEAGAQHINLEEISNV